MSAVAAGGIRPIRTRASRMELGSEIGALCPASHSTRTSAKQNRSKLQRVSMLTACASDRRQSHPRIHGTLSNNTPGHMRHICCTQGWCLLGVLLCAPQAAQCSLRAPARGRASGCSVCGDRCPRSVLGAEASVGPAADHPHCPWTPRPPYRSQSRERMPPASC